MDLNNLIQIINKGKTKFDIEIYLVGGAVRDLLLGSNPTDLDFVFIDKQDNIQQFISDTFNPNNIEKSQFNTYKFQYQNYEIDFAMSRKEFYSKAAALPQITKGNLKEDQIRRDFTINSIYINVENFSVEKLIEYTNGTKDLKNKEIKTLHKKSFQDDPTRIFRAIRYSERLNFKIHSETINEINSHLKNIKNLSGTRVKNEIHKIIKEEKVFEIIQECENYNIFKLLNLPIVFPKEKPIWGNTEYRDFNHLISEEKSIEFKFTIFLATFLNTASSSEIKNISYYWGIEKNIQKQWEELSKANYELKMFDTNNGSNSKLNQILINCNLQTCISFSQHLDPVLNKRIYDYWQTIRNLKPQLSSSEIIKIGIAEGPQLGEVIQELYNQVIDGKLKTKKDEIEFVKKITNLD